MLNNSINKSLRRKIGTAITKWHMINQGDNILVGLSGGKDSILLLHSLNDLSKRSPVKFSVSALTVKLSGMNTDILENYCHELNIKYSVIEHDIIGIINLRGEKSPCSFCANMRRGILSNFASENNFNKLALGHTLDDAVETFFMNLYHTGRAKSFMPTAHMSRTNITVIRPLILTSESSVIDETKRLALPIIKTSCPFAGHTERQRIREHIAELKTRIPDIDMKIIHALENLNENDSWKS